MSKKKKTIKNSFNRSLVLDLTRADKDKLTIPVTISTETPVETWRGPETLVHTKSAVNLSRAKRGLPLLDGHYGKVVGRVLNVRLSNRKLKGDLIFSRNDRGQEIYNDVIDKIITDVSVGGTRNQREKMSDGSIMVRKWTPMETSIEAIPADVNTGINRNLNGGVKMGKIFDEDGNEITKDIDEKKFIERGIEIELTRRQDINELFKSHMETPGVKDLKRKCKDDRLTVERSGKKLLALLGEEIEPIDKARATITHGDGAYDKFKIGMTRALSIRVGCATDEDKKDKGQNNFMSFTPVELARHHLDLCGISTMGMSRMQIVGAAFTRGIIGTATSSDFPNILADIANKSLLKGYNETEETWQSFCQVGNLANFMEALRPNLSEFDNLPEVPEGGEYDHGKFTDLAEKIKLLTYGKLFTITRQALINDDLSAMGRIPMSMGRSAARRVGDLAYGVLIDNPIMNQDGVALFHEDHDNLFATGAPDAETLDEMRVAMALQKGPAGHASLGIRPVAGICPLELETAFKTLVAAQYDPSSTAGTLTPNPVKDMVSVVADHRLSDADPEAWYLSASGSINDVIEVAFLDGNSTPFLDQQDGFTVDGVTYKVRIDAAAAPMDFRGLSKNSGAA